ncbi:MAG TPA: ATPase domain-containing protein [Gemmatimonadaceae bacterium]
MTERVLIRRLPTGVPGLDDVLGGGLPEFSFNLIAGAPGSGKTTLVHQIMFALARPDRPALVFTVLGEPPLKMLRYQQQFTFFDVAKVNASVRFINLGQEALNAGLGEVLKRISEEVEATSPGVVIVDSFRSVGRVAKRQNGPLDLQRFVQELAMRLTGWQATTFLVGEYQLSESEDNPVFTVADGLLWLYQSIDRNSMVRKMQVMKLRGQAPIPGLHTFRITDNGVQVFPRLIIGPEGTRAPGAAGKTKRHLPRLSIGVKGVDDMLGGGIPSGHSVLVAGPSGSGKTVLATQFISEGARHGEPGVIAVFEKRPSEYAQTSSSAFDQLVRNGQVGIIHTRPLDLSIDETLHDLTRAIQRLKARRVVIDSLSGFELALAPTFREDFRESLYRLVAVLTGMGITMLMTTELENSYIDLRFSPHGTAFLTDAIILQRYVELQGQLTRVMAVVKVRASAHSKELRRFEIGDRGIVVGERVDNYEGLLTGSPQLIRSASPLPRPPDKRRPKS